MHFSKVLRRALRPKKMPTDRERHPRYHFQDRKLIYLITNGQTNSDTTPASGEFAGLLALAQAAVDARVDLFQIREKNLSAKSLFVLTERIAAIARASDTKLLVNDRADVAASAGADGVHLATNSLPASVIRRTFGADFLIGVSTHSLAEAVAAGANDADFVVFGPVFSTEAKQEYGEPQGLERLEKVAAELGDFPVLALGGINVERIAGCMRAGARGVAAISMLRDPLQLHGVVAQIRKS